MRTQSFVLVLLSIPLIGCVSQQQLGFRTPPSPQLLTSGEAPVQARYQVLERVGAKACRATVMGQQVLLAEVVEEARFAALVSKPGVDALAFVRTKTTQGMGQICVSVTGRGLRLLSLNPPDNAAEAASPPGNDATVDDSDSSSTRKKR